MKWAHWGLSVLLATAGCDNLAIVPGTQPKGGLSPASEAHPNPTPGQPGLVAPAPRPAPEAESLKPAEDDVTRGIPPEELERLDEVVVNLGDRPGTPPVLDNLTYLRSLAVPGYHVYQRKPDVPMLRVLESLKANPQVREPEPNGTVEALSTPNDALFSDLWGHAKIQAPEAWDVVTGSAGVTVAVLDTGVDHHHQDLNWGQVVLGPDFINQDNDPMDDHGHGTHVAGTISARANNGTGIAGVSYGTKILAIKVLGANGAGSWSALAEGILKAHQMGAKVINLSLGGNGYSKMVEKAIQTATSGGTLVVAAAGNQGVKAPHFPAIVEETLAVGASDPSDRRAPFSNFGQWVDIAAPGTRILSTYQGVYKSLDGTSMATPHVAAAAALLWSWNASLSVSMVRDKLETTGDPVTGFEANPKLLRLNLFKALQVAPTPAPTATSGSEGGGGGGGGGGGNPEPTPTPTPTPTPQSFSGIVFTRDGDLYTMDPDGSNQVQLTSLGGTEEDPNVSLDGTKIAFAQYGNIYTMNADGTGTTLVKTQAAAQQPWWSPDGTKIAYAAHDGGGVYKVHVMNADGSGATPLTSLALDQYPCWSPDGTKILFTSSANGGGIHVVNADGSSPALIANNASWGRWSPDGTKIVYASDFGSGASEIAVMNADGTGITRLTNNAPVGDYYPAWTGDGLKILFESTRDGNFEIYVMNPDGSGQTNLSGFAGVDWGAANVP